MPLIHIPKHASTVLLEMILATLNISKKEVKNATGSAGNINFSIVVLSVKPLF